MSRPRPQARPRACATAGVEAKSAKTEYRWEARHAADPPLCGGLNAPPDFTGPVDIRASLIFGSDSTLACMSKTTKLALEEHVHKASALILFDLNPLPGVPPALKGGKWPVVFDTRRCAYRRKEFSTSRQQLHGGVELVLDVLWLCRRTWWHAPGAQ